MLFFFAFAKAEDKHYLMLPLSLLTPTPAPTPTQTLGVAAAGAAVVRYFCYSQKPARVALSYSDATYRSWLTNVSRAEKPSILINVSSGRNHKEKQYENLSKQRACACVCVVVCVVCVARLCVPLIMILKCCSNECANIQFN